MTDETTTTSELEPEAPKHGDLCIRLDGDESRPRRQKYRWRVLELREDSPSNERGWYQKRDDLNPDLVRSMRYMEGYAKTMRLAEIAGRHALVPYQCTSPLDPALPKPFFIDL